MTSSPATSTTRSGREIEVAPTTFLNTGESPLLRLPAELRNRIYDLVLGGHSIHIEGDKRQDTCKIEQPYNQANWLAFAGEEANQRRECPPYNEPLWTSFAGGEGQANWNGLQEWGLQHCLHYYVCKAAISEDVAYQRSQDATLNEQLPGPGIAANFWRHGDPFHIDSCAERHNRCYPDEGFHKPAWMRPPGDRTSYARTNVSLNKTLNLSFLHTSRQVYQEARNLPFSLNTFGFRSVVAFKFFLFGLASFQTKAIKSLWIFMRLGSCSDSKSAWRWNNSLLTPSLRPYIQGVRILHISLSVVLAGTGDNGPFRQEILTPHLDDWALGLNCFRALPLEKVTVIVADDPSSKYGIDGFSDRVGNYAWGHDTHIWLQIRARDCFTAAEKRQWAQRLRKRIMNESRDFGMQ
ncbi:hypothetical protein BCR34DRAFT_317006 [Clohesyomyces aquaticus]|uniref:Uncharacterized protein n=1 Tax=Clohesyomyces aquaticus TaxID=1231657 RepID=A0A1Y1ZNY1_9PLEO|nr:hypothetical protein BCR34DRAFT_317006 [Clohesyomyces aquaticus]